MGVWHWVRLRYLWITSKDCSIEREIVQDRIVSSSPKPLAKRHLLGLLTKKAKLWGGGILNGLPPKKRQRLLLLNLVDMVAWMPGLEDSRVKSDMVLPYVLTQPLKNRVGRKLCKQMSDQNTCANQPEGHSEGSRGKGQSDCQRRQGLPH